VESSVILLASTILPTMDNVVNKRMYLFQTPYSILPTTFAVKARRSVYRANSKGTIHPLDKPAAAVVA
jgi:hypothetical protein